MAISDGVFLYLILIGLHYILIIRNKSLHESPFGKAFIGFLTWTLSSIPFIFLTGDEQVVSFALSGIGLIYFLIKLRQGIIQQMSKRV